jgi:hypothetical protein
MRAAWSRRTDEELLHACFLEELSPSGRQVVDELVTAKFGAIDEYVRTFALAEGEVDAHVHVRACSIDRTVKDASLPVMWGVLVLTSAGLGFVPRGHDDPPGEDLVSIGFAFASSMSTQTQRTVQDLGRIDLPVPLLAHIEPNAIWLPHDRYDTLLWAPDFGEVVRGGERLLAMEPIEDAETVVSSWAAARGITLVRTTASPLLR